MPSDFGNSGRGKGKPKPKPKLTKQQAAAIGKAVAGAGKSVTKQPPARRAAPAGDTKGASEFKKAEAEKKTARYRGAVREAYKSQPVERRRERLKSGNPDAPETKVVKKLSADRARARAFVRAAEDYVARGEKRDMDTAVRKGLRVLRNQGTSLEELRDRRDGPKVDRRTSDAVVEALRKTGAIAGRDITKASPGKDKGDDLFDRAVGKLGDVAGDTVGFLSEKTGLGQAPGSQSWRKEDRVRAREVARVGAQIVPQVARTFAEDPGEATKNLAKDTVRAVPAAVGGLAQTPIKAVKDGPADALKELVRETEKATSERYRSLARGDEEGFREQTKKNPLPAVLDAALVAGPTARVVDTAAGTAARGGRDAAPRPRMRTAPGRTEAQRTSSGLAGRLAQAGTDAARARVQRERAKRGEAPTPRKGEVAPILAGTKSKATAPLRLASKKRPKRAVRNINSRSATRMRQRLEREVRPAEQAVRKHKLKDGADDLARPYVLQGLLPMDNPAGAVEIIDRWIADIESYREQTGARPTVRDVDEVASLRKLRAAIQSDSSKVFTPGLRALHDDELQRYHRMREDATQVFNDDVTEARRWRPIVERYDPQTARAADDEWAELEAAPDAPEGWQQAAREAMADYGRELAGRYNLPEPTYFLHRDVPGRSAGSMAAGSGARGAAPRRHSTEYELLRSGRWDQSHSAYVEGLGRQAKRAISYRQADEILQDFALRDARGEPLALTFRQAQKVPAYRDGQMKFWAPKVVRRDDDLDEALEVEGAPVGAPLKQGQYEDTSVGYLLPSEVVDEMEAAAAPTSAIGRGFGNAQGAVSSLLIYSNPFFPFVQIVSQFPLALLTAGPRNLDAFLRAPGFMRRLDDRTRDEVRALFSNEGAGQSITRRSHRGATANTRRIDETLEASHRFFSLLGLGRATKNVAFAPFRVIPKLDRLQDTYFRDVATFAKLKDQERAFRTMQAADRLYDAQRPVLELLRSGDRASMQDPKVRADVDRMAESMLEVMGDYVRYSAAERKVLRKAILFYGFLRHSTTLLLYTLPAKHPAIAALTLQLGELHADEIDSLLPEGETRTYLYPRIFLDADTSIDLTRANPLTNMLTEAATSLTGNDRQLDGVTALLSPPMQLGTDLAFGRNNFYDRPLYANGEEGGFTLSQTHQLIANRVEGWAFPIRELRNRIARGDGELGDDSSLLFGLEPTKFEPGTEDDLKNERKKKRQRSTSLLERLVPFAPEDDYSIEDARAVAKDKADDKLREADEAFRSRYLSDRAQPEQGAELTREDVLFRRKYGLEGGR